jgi:hypothetical protein
MRTVCWKDTSERRNEYWSRKSSIFWFTKLFTGTRWNPVRELPVCHWQTLSSICRGSVDPGLCRWSLLLLVQPHLWRQLDFSDISFQNDKWTTVSFLTGVQMFVEELALNCSHCKTVGFWWNQICKESFMSWPELLSEASASGALWASSEDEDGEREYRKGNKFSTNACVILSAGTQGGWEQQMEGTPHTTCANTHVHTHMHTCIHMYIPYIHMHTHSILILTKILL